MVKLRQLVAGNWKMNGTLASAGVLLNGLRAGAPGLSCEMLVCPPATLVSLAAHALLGSGAAVGGQDCHAKASGAHTGDISAAQLRDAGATFVILGHSERTRPVRGCMTTTHPPFAWNCRMAAASSSSQIS